MTNRQGSAGGLSAKPLLRDEMRILRRALNHAGRLLESGDEDFARIGGLVARLCETAARLQLARQRLETGEDQLGRLRAEMDEVLKSLGLGAYGEAKVTAREEGDRDDKRDH